MMEEKRPLILVSNDDGVEAKGIRELVRMIRRFGDVVVMAPDSARSGSGCAITVNLPVHYSLVKQEPGLRVYKCSGTPVDCVKMALHCVLDRKPDLVIGGINHGDNAAINAHYSGTMGVVIEGCFNRVPSIGFSLDNHDAAAEFSQLRPYIEDVVEKVLAKGLPDYTCLNVNFPGDEIKGIKATAMARGHWTQEWEPCPRRRDASSNYYWLTGSFINDEPEDAGRDRSAISMGYATVTPIMIDMTDYKMLDELNSWF
jgi:5'-nucleotidase